MREYERSEHGLGTETKSDLAYLSLGFNVQETKMNAVTVGVIVTVHVP